VKTCKIKLTSSLEYVGQITNRNKPQQKYTPPALAPNVIAAHNQANIPGMTMSSYPSMNAAGDFANTSIANDRRGTQYCRLSFGSDAMTRRECNWVSGGYDPIIIDVHYYPPYNYT
jgi:hypothetical protein